MMRRVKDHIRMNSNSFNHICYLLQNLGGLRRSCYTISKHFNTILNNVLKLHTILLVQHVPKDNNDYRWKYFKGCLCALDGTYVPVRGSATDNKILRDVITRTNGLIVLTGSYYLCDGGYTNDNGFLAPYRGVMYHLKE
ncbi:hypothetical protein ACS0TY_007811 [Phlomoides rotata]